jgi:rhodanese-related sulfurtransferase
MLTTRFSLAAVVLSAVVSTSAFAQETPTTLEKGKVVTVAEAKTLLDGKTATFVDTRSVVNFGKGHIPGALAIGYKEGSDKVVNFDASKDSFDFAKIPDKAKPVVFYSDGPTGWKSYKAAVTAVKAGYTNVSYFRGGFAEWEGKGFAVGK